mgnify:CR=1 FL=1
MLYRHNYTSVRLEKIIANTFLFRIYKIHDTKDIVWIETKSIGKRFDISNLSK